MKRRISVTYFKGLPAFAILSPFEFSRTDMYRRFCHNKVKFIHRSPFLRASTLFKI